MGVETNEGPYDCGRLVLATGAWAARLPATVRIDLPVRPARASVALFRRPADSGRRGVVIADFVQGLYLRPAQGDLIHAGDLATPPTEPLLDPDSYNEAADGDWLSAIRQRLIRRYPAMHCGFGRGGYALLTDLTPDGRPILDSLPGLEGAYCAAGFGGDNFLLVAPGRPGPDSMDRGQHGGRPGTDAVRTGPFRGGDASSRDRDGRIEGRVTPGRKRLVFRCRGPSLPSVFRMRILSERSAECGGR